MARGSALALALVALCAMPATAHAVQRYAEPNGSSMGACPQDDPCEIVRAVNTVALADDEVIIESGDYGSETAPLTTPIVSAQPDLDVHGEDGKPRPRIFSQVGDNLSGVRLSGSGSTVRYLAIHQLVVPSTSGGLRS